MKNTLYTAEAQATGGRAGHIRSSDGVIDMDMSAPEGLGGKKGATNPEQLFAAGYASCFQQALTIARRQQAKAWELRAAMSLSRLWQQQGKPEDARQLLAGVYDWFTEGLETPDIQEARALLAA